LSSPRPSALSAVNLFSNQITGIFTGDGAKDMEFLL
jgi:hypothetical protein